MSPPTSPPRPLQSTPPGGPSARGRDAAPSDPGGASLREAGEPTQERPAGSGSTAPAAPAPSAGGRRQPIAASSASPAARTGVGRSGGGLRFTLRRLGISPALRLLGAGLAGLASVVLGGLADRVLRRRDREARSERRLRAAAVRGVRALGLSRGLYVKAGQFASLRPDLVPPPVAEELAALQDRVPPVPFDTVRATLEAELGPALGDRVESVDPEPLGAASLAQAHRARLRDGREVVLKVQYPWLRSSLPADLAVLRAALFLLLPRRRGRRVDRGRLFAELAGSLAAELDFRREAHVAEEIAANLADDPQVVVPAIVPELGTGRVLAMEYHPALRLDDRDVLVRRGVDPAELLEVLARAYGRQVFVDGLFHADPHPGNLFALPPTARGERARVLFVDFGLSRRLSPDLRRALRRGLYAVLQRDPEELVERMDALGMIAPGAHAGVRRAVDEMFGRITERSGGGPAAALGVSGAAVPGLKDEAKRLLRETPGLQLPTDLLLYARTLSYLFTLGERLAPEVDLVRLMLPHLLRFLSQRE